MTRSRPIRRGPPDRGASRPGERARRERRISDRSRAPASTSMAHDAPSGPGDRRRRHYMRRKPESIRCRRPRRGRHGAPGRTRIQAASVANPESGIVRRMPVVDPVPVHVEEVLPRSERRILEHAEVEEHEPRAARGQKADVAAYRPRPRRSPGITSERRGVGGNSYRSQRVRSSTPSPLVSTIIAIESIETSRITRTPVSPDGMSRYARAGSEAPSRPAPRPMRRKAPDRRARAPGSRQLAAGPMTIACPHRPRRRPRRIRCADPE